MKNDENLIEKAKKIKLTAFDVDGVMTDGSLTFDENGVEYKTFNAKDGQGIVLLNQNGFITAIITARENGTIHERAKMLNITKLLSGSKNKSASLDELLKEFNVKEDEIAYMGDDIPDIETLKRVSIKACPKDAVSEVKEVCNFISDYNGGRGAVRELCDFLIKYKNK